MYITINEGLGYLGATALAEINTTLPAEGVGYRTSKSKSHQFGLPETIKALEAIGRAWHWLHWDEAWLMIGDISLKSGGKFDPQVSHRVGLDVDIRAVRRFNPQHPGKWHDPVTIRDTENYSQPLTQDLVDIIWNNGVLKVKMILFDDESIVGVKKDGDHDDHLHVRFCAPPYFASKVDSRYKDCESASRPSPSGCHLPPFETASLTAHPQTCGIAPTPTPNYFYSIKSGDTLYKVAGKAYGLPEGSRLQAARRINDHPYNRRFRRADLADQQFPNGRISFNPRFSCNQSEQAQAIGKAPSGNCFATIYIPQRPKLA